ncbi:MAG: class I SAM-dependent methyltransferase [Patescibacteria group bacterium]|nr:class I SAM-dependent methyltransferase [Patescibacteria group bacterium]
MNETSYWKNKWSKRPLEPANNFAKRAFKLIKEKNLKTLLDLGCGDGRDSIYFSNNGLKVTAVDFSESGINKLKSQNEKINCIVKDIRNISFAENSFDVIYAHLTLHYFDDKTTSKIFNNLYEILKKGGLIFVKCKSTDDTLFGKGKKVGENMYKKGHIRHFFTKEYMTEKLKRFKIIKVKKTLSVYHEYKSAFIEAVATK